QTSTYYSFYPATAASDTYTLSLHDALPILNEEPANGRAKLSIASNPDGAEIEIDGAFMGNTPAVLELEPGDHTVALRRGGYRLWQRKIRVSGGRARLNGALEAMDMGASSAQ